MRRAAETVRRPAEVTTQQMAPDRRIRAVTIPLDNAEGGAYSFLVVFLSVLLLQTRVMLSDLTITPEMGPHKTAITIRVRVDATPDLLGEEEVFHLVREGRERIQVRMYDDGTHADPRPRDGHYTGQFVVPDTAAEGLHQFTIFVIDKKGGRSNLLRFEFTVVGRRVPVT